MLHLNRIAKRCAGVAKLQDISLQVDRGECVGLLGASGSGRSTLLRVAATLIAPDSGEIVIDGIDARREVSRARRVTAYVGGPAQTPPGLQVSEYIRTAVAGRGTASGNQAIRDAIARAGLSRTSDVAAMSPATRWRVALTAALAANPRLLLIDDRLHEREEAWKDRALEWIAGARDGGAAVIIASDDRGNVEHLCTRVLRLDAGRVVDADSLATMNPSSTGQVSVVGIGK